MNIVNLGTNCCLLERMVNVTRLILALIFIIISLQIIIKGFKCLTTSIYEVISFSLNYHDAHSPKNDEANNQYNHINGVLTVVLIKAQVQTSYPNWRKYLSSLEKHVVYKYNTWAGVGFTISESNSVILENYTYCHIQIRIGSWPSVIHFKWALHKM